MHYAITGHADNCDPSCLCVEGTSKKEAESAFIRFVREQVGNKRIEVYIEFVLQSDAPITIAG